MTGLSEWLLKGKIRVKVIKILKEESSDEEDGPPHFTYEGEEGPEHWGELDASYETCGTGQSQSPIDLTGALEQDLDNIVFHYQPTKIHLVNNGHTVKVNYDTGSYIEVDGKRYDLLQFHFHAPSENAIDGKLFPIEMHLVHKNDAGQLAAVGVFFDKGAESTALKPVWDNMPTEEGEKEVDALVNAADLLPSTQSTYRFSGSLTTPPCTEGVSWFVMATPAEVSDEQISAFEQVYHGNNRPLQPLNGRVLILASSPQPLHP
ncbi:MAG: carbonic anhydrase family protein [Deltaproteobacteria bacterium]|jgi:carbonic anhydrase|nr:carbonic anhydrase family protein [Deltaproteobacteria bacterium]